MPLSDVDRMRSSIADVIGWDLVYITAKNDMRHVDPIRDAWMYAGKLLFGFASLGGIWHWTKLKKKGAETGEKAVGDAMNAALER